MSAEPRNEVNEGGGEGREGGATPTLIRTLTCIRVLASIRLIVLLQVVYGK